MSDDRQMKVYVLNADYGHEGESTVGVFSTEEKAVRAARKSPRVYQDKWSVYEVTVDSTENPEEVEVPRSVIK